MFTKAIYIPVLVMLFFSGTLRAQGLDPRNAEKLRIMEDSLIMSADSMYHSFIPDMRIDYSERFARQLVRTLKIEGSYYYGFDSLKKQINIIYPDDNAFRVFNWAISPNRATKRYYGAIQMAQNKLKLYGLLDYSEQLGKGGGDSILTGGKWFGGLCYRVLSRDMDGRKIYFMFSYNSGSPISNKKILDPFMFTERGVVFGAPVFNIASENFRDKGANRFVLEYKKDVQVSMNWEPEKQVVIFDNLVSQMNDPNRKYTFVPSGQYDGLRWVDGRWNYLRDLMPITVLKDGEAPADEPK